MSKIRPVRPREQLPSTMHPRVKGNTASGVKIEVAEPKITTSGKMNRQSIIPLLTAHKISPAASDSALMGVAKIAS